MESSIVICSGMKLSARPCPSDSYGYLGTQVVFLYIPIALLIIYTVIVIKLKTEKIPGEQSNKVEQQRRERSGKVVKMAIAIVVGFVVCWIPWDIMNLLSFSAWTCPSVAFGSMTLSPTLLLTRIVPSTLASVLFSVEIIDRDSKDS